MTTRVKIFEVGARDGLQNESRLVSVTDKVYLVNLLSACVFSHIEVGSFVRADKVPQMSDTDKVFAGIDRRDGVSYAALVPNLRGFELALSAGADEVAVFASASEGFSFRNINCSVSDSLDRFDPIFSRATEDGMRVRGYVSCVTDCPYDGEVGADRVAYVVRHFVEKGCYEISLGDTIGKGTPDRVDLMLERVLQEASPEMLAGHFHDTNGMALDNVEVCLERGLRTFDSSIAGLGGCPYAPGKNGNLDTSDLNRLLISQGYETGLDIGALQKALDFALKITS